MTGVAAQSVPSASPAGWLRSETSPIEDIAAEPTTEVSVPGSSIISLSFTVPRTGRYRVWLNALRDPAQRGIAVRVDSDRPSRIGLRSSFGSGYRWNPTRPLALTGGTHHVTLTTIGPRSLIAHLTNLAVTPVTGRPLRLITALRTHVIREIGGTGPITLTTRVKATHETLTRGAWHLLPANGYVSSTHVRSGGIEIHVRRGGRQYFTLATASAARMDPTRAFAIRFRGSGDGRTYYLNVMFRGTADASLGYRFRDTRKGLRTIVLSPLQPSFSNVSPDWLHVRGFSLSSSTRTRPRGPLTIEGPFATRVSLTPHFSGGLRASANSAKKRQSAIATGAGQLRDTLKLRSVRTPGLLVFTESYNTDWRLRGQPNAQHIVALGFANGYDLRRPLRPGSSLTYRLAPIGRDATYASALAWGLLGIGLLPLRRRRRRQ